MDIPELRNFPLVGGTNLSLRFGRRTSVDLDLFTNTPFIPDEVFSAVVKACPQAIRIDQRKQTIWLSINNIKVDLILHEYPYITGIEEIEGIRLLAVEDVIPMKLEAMATRGVKKDFWDIAELLTHYSLAQIKCFSFINNATLTATPVIYCCRPPILPMQKKSRLTQSH